MKTVEVIIPLSVEEVDREELHNDLENEQMRFYNQLIKHEYSIILTDQTDMHNVIQNIIL